MSTTGGLRTRLVKKVDPPRPLKSAVKSSASEVVKSDVDTGVYFFLSNVKF